MTHTEFIYSKKHGKITYFYDTRSEKRAVIEDFLQSEYYKNLENSLEKDIFLSL